MNCPSSIDLCENGMPVVTLHCSWEAGHSGMHEEGPEGSAYLWGAEDS